jgi:hypothetical protein
MTLAATALRSRRRGAGMWSSMTATTFLPLRRSVPFERYQHGFDATTLPPDAALGYAPG